MKLKAVLIRKDEIDTELVNLRNRNTMQLSQYDLQINEIQKLNCELNEREIKDINSLTEMIDQQIYDFRTLIFDKKLKIREFLGKLNDSNSQKNSLVNSYLRKINDVIRL